MADDPASKKIRLDSETEQLFQNFDIERFQKQALFSRLRAYKELCGLLECEKAEILNRALPEGITHRIYCRCVHCGKENKR